jgi:Flp pilus assembly pilin Flp
MTVGCNAKRGSQMKSSRTITSVLRRLVEDDSGQDLAEYAIATGVIAVGAMAAAIGTSSNVQRLWELAVNATAAAL